MDRNDQSEGYSYAVKGRLFACVAATAVLHVAVTLNTPREQLTTLVLLGSLLWAGIFFIFIAVVTLVPSIVFVWIVHKLRIDFSLVFVVFGVALGLGAQTIFEVLPNWAPLVAGGALAGITYSVVTRKARLARRQRLIREKSVLPS
jgi:hypothetical protein